MDFRRVRGLGGDAGARQSDGGGGEENGGEGLHQGLRRR